MNVLLNSFIQGFLKGARETPGMFFAPAIAIWRILLDTTESLVRQTPKAATKPRYKLDKLLAQSVCRDQIDPHDEYELRHQLFQAKVF